MKELIAQTIHVIVVLVLIYSTWLYVFRREIFDEILKAGGVIAPLVFLFISYALITARRVDGMKKIMEEAEASSYEDAKKQYTTLFASQQDEMKNDGIAIFSAFAIVILAKIINNKIDYPDVLQALVAIIAVYSTKKIYFKDKFSWTGDKENNL